MIWTVVACDAEAEILEMVRTRQSLLGRESSSDVNGVQEDVPATNLLSDGSAVQCCIYFEVVVMAGRWR